MVQTHVRTKRVVKMEESKEGWGRAEGGLYQRAPLVLPLKGAAAVGARWAACS